VEQVLSGSQRGLGGGEVSQTMYTYVSKSKNDKILKKEQVISHNVFENNDGE
jgi:hypothetical protein